VSVVESSLALKLFAQAGVDGREAKRHAEDLAMQATGVKDVQNNLRIVQEGGEAR